jgi:mRNA interferase RelE/StbE
MSFEVFLHPKSARAFSKLEKETKERIKTKLSELRESLERKGERLKHSDFWSLRIGDFRAIYEIDGENDQAVVLFIGHRRDVYDDFSKLF